MKLKRKLEVAFGTIQLIACMGLAVAAYALMTIAERIEEKWYNG